MLDQPRCYVHCRPPRRAPFVPILLCLIPGILGGVVSSGAEEPYPQIAPSDEVTIPLPEDPEPTEYLDPKTGAHVSLLGLSVLSEEPSALAAELLGSMDKAFQGGEWIAFVLDPENESHRQIVSSRLGLVPTEELVVLRRLQDTDGEPLIDFKFVDLPTPRDVIPALSKTLAELSAMAGRFDALPGEADLSSTTVSSAASENRRQGQARGETDDDDEACFTSSPPAECKSPITGQLARQQWRTALNFTDTFSGTTNRISGDLRLQAVNTGADRLVSAKLAITNSPSMTRDDHSNGYWYGYRGYMRNVYVGLNMTREGGSRYEDIITRGTPRNRIPESTVTDTRTSSFEWGLSGGLNLGGGLSGDGPSVSGGANFGFNIGWSWGEQVSSTYTVPSLSVEKSSQDFGQVQWWHTWETKAQGGERASRLNIAKTLAHYGREAGGGAYYQGNQNSPYPNPDPDIVNHGYEKDEYFKMWRGNASHPEWDLAYNMPAVIRGDYDFPHAVIWRLPALTEADLRNRDSKSQVEVKIKPFMEHFRFDQTPWWENSMWARWVYFQNWPGQTHTRAFTIDWRSAHLDPHGPRLVQAALVTGLGDRKLCLKVIADGNPVQLVPTCANDQLQWMYFDKESKKIRLHKGFWADDGDSPTCLEAFHYSGVLGMAACSHNENQLFEWEQVSEGNSESAYYLRTLNGSHYLRVQDGSAEHLELSPIKDWRSQFRFPLASSF